MNRDLQRHKRNDCVKWIAVFLAVILLATGVAAALTQGFKDANPYCWFGHDYGEDGVCVRCGKEKTIDEDDAAAHGENMLFATTQSHGISVVAEPLSESASVPATIAANSQTLTATITPSDATNKAVDWSIAWQNSSSTWAKGKTISDYLTITPTSDGALTATVTCKKAFGERAIVTCKVRTDDTLTATCSVDYKKRVVGVDFSMKITWNDEVPVNWSFVHTNLNPTVDFPAFKAGWSYQNWVLGFCEKDNTSCPVTVFYSDFTATSSYDGVAVFVAPTAEYIAALKAAGFTTAVNAGEYVQLNATNGGTFPEATVGDLLIGNLVAKRSGTSAKDGINDYTQFSKLQTYLREHSSSVMLQIKLQMIGGDSTRDAVTVYNVKFSSSSLQTLAQSLSVTNGITF